MRRGSPCLPSPRAASPRSSGTRTPRLPRPARRTSGNPFFVTEILAALRRHGPRDVRDAVLARAARLDPRAQSVLDAVAVVPRGAELWLLEAITGNDLDGLERASPRACSGASGRRSPSATRSRASRSRSRSHRMSGSSSTPARSTRWRAPGTATPIRPASPTTPRRPTTARRCSPTRPPPASAPRGWGRIRRRPPSSSGRCATPTPSTRPRGPISSSASPTRRTSSLHRRRDRRPAARPRRARAGEGPPAPGRRASLAVPAGLVLGRQRRRDARGAPAVQLLEAHPPGRELAMAYSNLAQLRMLASDLPGATQWGTKAIALAEELDETETLAHALNNVGSAELVRGDAAGREKLERSLALALDAGLDEHVARAFTNLGSITARRVTYRGRGVSHGRDRLLHRARPRRLGHLHDRLPRPGRARPRPAPRPRRSAESVLEHPGVTAPVRIPPLVVLGRIAARTGARPVARPRRGEGAPRAPGSSSASAPSRSRGPRRAGWRASRSASTPRPRTCWPRASPAITTGGSSVSWPSGAGARGCATTTSPRRTPRALPSRARRPPRRGRAPLGVNRLPLRGGACPRPRLRRGRAARRARGAARPRRDPGRAAGRADAP